MGEYLGGLMTNRIIEENLGLLSNLQSFDKKVFIRNDDFSFCAYMEQQQISLAFSRAKTDR
jgi:hypothetical protein